MTPKKFGPKSLVKIGPATSEILLIWTNVARAYVGQMSPWQLASFELGPKILSSKIQEYKVPLFFQFWPLCRYMAKFLFLELSKNQDFLYSALQKQYIAISLPAIKKLWKPRIQYFELLKLVKIKCLIIFIFVS